ncbi:MAG TPA: HigA family addiction module antitoxin, partial [Kiloniellales bacterium]|nr:HigA family addiction module antitoxin [Kiloniellales bacterium]
CQLRLRMDRVVRLQPPRDNEKVVKFIWSADHYQQLYRVMMMIHDHPHPGEILKETAFEPLKLSVTEAASRLGMSRVALSRVLNGKSGISPDLALRLEKAGVSTARFWVHLQANYELWQALQHEQPPVRPLQEAAI